MRTLVCALVLLATVSAASGANLLTNGDFSAGENGWTRWRAPWGGTEQWDASGGVGLQYGNGGNGSYGWWQAVAVPAGTVVTLSADWNGFIGDAGWAEVMLYTSANAGEDWGGRADGGATADIAFKKDSWGLNPPTTWGWEAASLSPMPGGNGGTLISAGYVAVATKLGGFPLGSVAFDNIVLTPEPASALLLGLGLALVRRRR